MRAMMLSVAACAVLLVGVEAASAQGISVGVYRGGYGRGISVGVGYGYGYPGYYGGYRYGYPGYYGYYPAYRPYYGYPGYYPSYSYYNYYTPRVIVPTYVPSVVTPVYGVPTYSGVAQAAYTVPANAALVTVNVPANAEIWFSGDKTSQTGSSRRFETPPLEPGSNYSYVVRAKWTENGKERDETKKVAVHANDRVSVDFP